MAACWGGGILYSQWRGLAREEEEEAVEAGALQSCLGQAKPSIADQRQAMQSLGD